MKASEIWSVRLADGETAFLRVMLRLGSLDIPRDHPMAFLGDAALVQVAMNKEFCGADLLVNGLFVCKPATARRFGFERVGVKAVTSEEIEFPCWLMDSHGVIAFCRGELVTPVRSDDPSAFYRRWNVRLGVFFPRHIATILQEFWKDYERLSRGEQGPSGIPGSDVRYHPSRDRICAEAGISLAATYSDEIARTTGGRRVV